MIELDYAHDGSVALLTLKRPPANAFTPDGLLQLQHTIERLNGDAQVRAIVNDAAEFATNDPEPDPSELWTDVVR